MLLVPFSNGIWSNDLHYEGSPRMIKALLKKIARSFGYQIARVQAPSAVLHENSSGMDPFAHAKSMVHSVSPIIFDVGAHQGQTTQELLTLWPQAKIFCFEPSSHAFRSLKEKYGGDSRVSLFQHALSDSVGVAPLNVNGSDATNSLLQTDEPASNYWHAELLRTHAVETVATNTIDSVAEKACIERINLLKLDVQGAEFRVLKGADGLLMKKNIDLIYLEILAAPTYVQQPRVDQYFEMLSAYGYQLTGLFDPVTRGRRINQLDAMFVRNNLQGQT